MSHHQERRTPKNPLDKLANAIASGLEAMNEQMEDQPDTPQAWFEENIRQDRVDWSAFINEAPCECGGNDGYILFVSHKFHPVTKEKEKAVVIYRFDHHVGGMMSVLRSPEEMKDMINRLGEAVAAAERI